MSYKFYNLSANYIDILIPAIRKYCCLHKLHSHNRIINRKDKNQLTSRKLLICQCDKFISTIIGMRRLYVAFIK
jgi:hypothetical protein